MNEVKTDNFMSVELLMREFYARKNLQVPKHYYRIIALVMLDKYYSIDNLHAIKRVYNRIRHCRHSMLVSTVKALDILEDSYTYTPDMRVSQLEYTIDDGVEYKIGTLDGLTAKKYELEQSANSIADKINNETLTNNLFQSMPETRYLALKTTVATLLDYYDRELKGEKLTKEEKKQKKSRQEKIRTYLYRWYGVKATVNYSFCVAYYESMLKFETGYYTD